MARQKTAESSPVESVVSGGVDLVEWYYEKGFSDGFPVVPPTPEKVAATVEALGGDADYVEARVPPRWGSLTREVLAINMVMAMFGGCMIPVMFMPKFIERMSVLSPVKWAILAIEGAIWRQFTYAEMAMPCLILIGVGIAGILIGTAVMNKRP